MKLALLLGVLGGFAGVLAGAHYFPWGEHARLPSKTTVQPNGGRVEQFVIRLPADRIGSAGAGLRGTHESGRVELPGALGDASMLVEHFKLRDADNHVIGIAARHWTVGDGRAASVWSVVIPSRGALTLTGAGEPQNALEDALAVAGRIVGAAWNGDVRLEVTREEPGRLVLGTREFAGLEGSYSETWRINGVGENGELRGTIELSTITQRGA